jgi:hypothetical protein
MGWLRIRLYIDWVRSYVQKIPTHLPLLLDLGFGAKLPRD